jgi:hypothetical protein
MNNKEIITTALKIFGLYFLTLTVINLRDLLFLSTDIVRSYQDNQENWIVISGQIYSGIFNLIVGLLLLTKSG